MNRFDLLKQTNTDLAARVIIEFGKDSTIIQKL